MEPRAISGLDELRTLVGQRLGTSDWLEITQARVDAFADGTDDHQWIHCDPERAKRESPYGGTVAHGFLTLSLCNVLSQQVFRIEQVRMVLNYGLNRVRFPGPVRVGSRIRMSSDLLEVKETRSGVQMVCKQTFEVEGEARPACIAETVVRLFFT
ncbi:MAG TPA: MaoC family dehydratase [Pirellulales bacterium]|nr:MaoC family dehydratase [Pirellulales bacterium]